MPVTATAVVAPMVDVVSPATLEEGEKSEMVESEIATVS